MARPLKRARWAAVKDLMVDSFEGISDDIIVGSGADENRGAGIEGGNGVYQLSFYAGSSDSGQLGVGCSVESKMTRRGCGQS